MALSTTVQQRLVALQVTLRMAKRHADGQLAQELDTRGAREAVEAIQNAIKHAALKPGL